MVASVGSWLGAVATVARFEEAKGWWLGLVTRRYPAKITSSPSTIGPYSRWWPNRVRLPPAATVSVPTPISSTPSARDPAPEHHWAYAEPNVPINTISVPRTLMVSASALRLPSLPRADQPASRIASGSTGERSTRKTMKSDCTRTTPSATSAIRLGTSRVSVPSARNPTDSEAPAR